MDIAQIPIVDFLKYCKQGAREKGFYWLACIICRERDSEQFYTKIKNDWNSLDSITGKKLLILFAGNETRDNALISDTKKAYVKRYNPFVTIIGAKTKIKVDLSSVRWKLLKEQAECVEQTQTDAVDSLMNYFGVQEYQVPCLVYIPLYKDKYVFDNVIIPIPNKGADLYRYFKEIFNEIGPKIVKISSEQNDLLERIDVVHDNLMMLIKGRRDEGVIIQSMDELKYYKCDKPVRGEISRYIDLCKEYERKYKQAYSYYNNRKSDLLREIEEVFKNKSIYKEQKQPVSVCISIGENNTLEGNQFNVSILSIK